MKYSNEKVLEDNKILREKQNDIIHMLEYRDSKEWVTIVNGAKDREKAYFQTRNQLEQIILHCRNNPCNLPTELAIIKTERQFDSLETMIFKGSDNATQ